jgi:hypothetical protein
MPSPLYVAVTVWEGGFPPFFSLVKVRLPGLRLTAGLPPQAKLERRRRLDRNAREVRRAGAAMPR